MAPHFCAHCYKHIAAVVGYFDREKANNGPLLPFAASRERAARALQVAINTVSKIASMVATGQPLPGSAKSHRGNTVTDISEMQAAEIRNVIYEMHANKEHITRKSLLERLSQRHLFEGSVGSLGKVLRAIGFRFKRDDNRLALIELPGIALLRTNFLTAYVNNVRSDSPRQVVFLDETWVFENGSTTTFSLRDSGAKSGRIKKGDGTRHIVVHAGGRMGFVQNATLIFASRTSTGDYHGDINEEHFLQWFEHQLLRQLEEPSIIVMDNASYHSTVVEKCPNAIWQKRDMQQWLRNRNIPFDAALLKTQLKALIDMHKPPKVYKADQLALQYGHEVLRLPPYHCIFNPSELIWAVAKNHYVKHNGREKSSEKSLAMWQEALEQITPEVWNSSMNHTESVIETWWTREHLLDRDEVMPIVINVDSDENSSEFDDSD